MKYNSLLLFRAELGRSLAPSTAHTYYKAMDFLLKDQYLMDCKKLDVGKVVQKLQAMKYKNQYSKYKNAFLKFCDFLHLKLPRETLNALDVMSREKVKKRRSLKAVSLEDITNHIRVMRDSVSASDKMQESAG